MRTETEGTAEWRAAMNAALGPDARLFAIIARGGFAVRYGPLTLAQCDDLIELGENEHFPVMITADCGALPDADLAMSLFGETRAERAALAAKQFQRGEDMMTALQTLGKAVSLLLSGRYDSDAASKLHALRDAFKPIDALAKEMQAERPRTTQTTAIAPLDQTVDADEATLSQADEAKREAIRNAVMIGSIKIKSERMVNRFLESLHADGFDVVHRNSPAPAPGTVPENRWITLRDRALEFYRDAVRALVREDKGHEGSSVLETASGLRHALIDCGIYPKQLETR